MNIIATKCYNCGSTKFNIPEIYNETIMDTKFSLIT